MFFFFSFIFLIEDFFWLIELLKSDFIWFNIESMYICTYV